ncbi:hypothetical protein D3C77_720610 [compost metagenome]
MISNPVPKSSACKAVQKLHEGFKGYNSDYRKGQSRNQLEFLRIDDIINQIAKQIRIDQSECCYTH